LACTRSEPDPVQSAIRFIADQFGGPGRVLAHHRTTVTGLCAASARHAVTGDSEIARNRSPQDRPIGAGRG
jgi:hypothetical protein